MKRILLGVALCCFLAACGSSAPAAPTAARTPSPTPTVPSPTAAPTPTATATATPTNVPPVHVSPSATTSAAPGGASPGPCTSPFPSPVPLALPLPPSTFGQGQRQWAATASATTSYSPYCGQSWNASQAVGAPNATCSDDGHAWASASAITVDTLTLGYTDKVIPTAVRVIQSFNPGHVSKVSVSGAGQTATVFTSPADAPGGGACTPLEIAISNVTFAVDTVAVTVDQTKVGSWAEIDAVELIGNKP